MPYVTFAERYAMGKGLQQGIEALIDVRYPESVPSLAPLIRRVAERDALEQIMQLAKRSSLEEIRAAIEAAQPRLDLSVLADLPHKTVILGVLDLSDSRPETAEQVAHRIAAALEFINPDRLVLGPDCGMKYLSRAVAFAKLQALVAGAAIVRSRLS